MPGTRTHQLAKLVAGGVAIALLSLGVPKASGPARALGLTNDEVGRAAVAAAASNSGLAPAELVKRLVQAAKDVATSDGRNVTKPPVRTRRRRVGNAKVAPGTGGTLTGSDGVQVRFSGHELPSPVNVNAELSAVDGNGLLADEDAPALVTADEAGKGLPDDGVLLSDVLDVSAAGQDGSRVTRFPDDVQISPAHGEEPATVTHFAPGVAIALRVNAALADQADPGSVGIWTRETADQPWTEIPSYLDTATGVVHGEVDHLSQFVVIGTPVPVTPKPSIVLDPDDNVGWASEPPPKVHELPLNMKLAKAVASDLQTQCQASVVITRSGSDDVVDPAIRAGKAKAAKPQATIGVAFDAIYGDTAWGTKADGGTKAYSRGKSADDKLRGLFVSTLPKYTTRPAKKSTATGAKARPYREFGSVPGAVVHLETLYMDHIYDRPVIDKGMSSIANGYSATIISYLGSLNQGFNCVHPTNGGYPTKPTAAEIKKWRQLGARNYQAYGAEPVSMATGNVMEREPVFDLEGPGGQDNDIALYYNSQDGRESRTGYSWVLSEGARAQRFAGGSVMVVDSDGVSYVFSPNGKGGYLSPRGADSTLAEAGNGKLRWTFADRSSYTFAAGGKEGIGRLIQIRDANGLVTTLSYGPATAKTRFEPLTGIKDSAGRTIRITNDALGRITRITHPDGRAWSLAYSARGEIAKITYPNGTSKRFTYDAKHQLTTATDQAGVKYLANSFNGAGQIVRQVDGLGGVRTFAYAANRATGGMTVRYKDANGRVSSYVSDSGARVIQRTEPGGGIVKYSYDSNDNQTRSTDELGHVTTWTYDAAGNATSMMDPGRNVTTMTYAAGGQLRSVTDNGGPRGAKRTVTRDIDSRGNVTAEHYANGTMARFTYDPASNLTSQTSPGGAVTRFTCDKAGNPVTMTDALGNKTSIAYDKADRPVRITEANGAVTTLTWDKADQLTRQVEANGAVTRYAYTPVGHLASVTDPDGRTSRFSWDREFDLTAATDQLGHTERYAYDHEGNLTSVTDPNGHRTTYQLGPDYDVTAVIDANRATWRETYDKAGQVTSATDPLGKTVTYGYDANGNQVSARDESGAVFRARYDQADRLIADIDAKGNTTSYAYDTFDQLTKVTNADGTSQSFAYDKDGNLTGQTDERGNRWGAAYDRNGNEIADIDPLGNTTRYRYDKAGNLTWAKDPEGRVWQGTYDAVGQLTKETGAGSTSTYRYTPAGLLAAQSDGLGHTTRYTYDKAGQLISQKDPAGYVTQLGYDSAGQLIAQTSATKVKTRYDYDPAGNLTATTENYVAGAKANATTNVRTSYGYDRAGQLTSITDPLKGVSRFGYDARGLLSTETDQLGQTWKDTYDSLGQLIARRAPTGITTRYAYDKMGQVTTVTSPHDGVTQFGYDKAGAMITMKDQTGTTGWQYDAAGQLIKQNSPGGTQVTYAYNRAGQLAALGLPSGATLSYAYNRDGLLSRQSSKYGSIGYTWDKAGEITGEKRSNGINTSYSYDPRGYVTRIVDQTPASPAKQQTQLAAGSQAASTSGLSTLWDNLDISKQVPPDPTSANTDCAKSSSCLSASKYLQQRLAQGPASAINPGDSLQIDLAWDGNGSLASKTVTAGAQAPTKTSYSYDPLQRLTKSKRSDGVNEAFAYDAAGNRTAWSYNVPGNQSASFTQAQSYNKASQVVASKRTTNDSNVYSRAYEYDASGNRIKDYQTSGPVTGGGPAWRTYAYSDQDLITKAAEPGLSAAYARDGLGDVTSSTYTTTLGASTTKYVNSAAGLVGQQVDAKPVQDMISDALGNLTEVESASGVSWELADELGSTIAQAGASGIITQISGYAAYGSQSNATDGWDSPSGYQGQVSDPALGITSYAVRALDNLTGQWLSKDMYRGTLDDPQSLERYAFVENNPTSYIDVGGFFSLMSWAKSACKTVGHWVAKNRESIVSTVVSTVVTVGLTPFVGPVVAGAIGGAAGGIAGYAARPGRKGWNWRDAGKAAGEGAIEGAAFGILGAGARGFAKLAEKSVGLQDAFAQGRKFAASLSKNYSRIAASTKRKILNSVGGHTRQFLDQVSKRHMQTVEYITKKSKNKIMRIAAKRHPLSENQACRPDMYPAYLGRSVSKKGSPAEKYVWRQVRNPSNYSDWTHPLKSRAKSLGQAGVWNWGKKTLGDLSNGNRNNSPKPPVCRIPRDYARPRSLQLPSGPADRTAWGLATTCRRPFGLAYNHGGWLG